MAVMDETKQDEVLYREYIKTLSVGTALNNYLKALFYEPLSLLHVGFLLLIKTPLMLSVPGKVALSWQVYCMGIKALPISYSVAKKELFLKLFKR
ncbi:hypothetical protein [Planctobacterium marinum]|uniref:Uncharacterized protein n=1 Tax=Planctobacterium marinum TaxID=1631968 RepID=A0AA48KP62_9ALTE|nr:hypothetical protein MACH26_18220 [Planctobacterium marinum]